ncbi:MAG: T9SS type A sorting domain-containing protein, partial [Bacteroidales bacterium]|nr:T9SS type A sorting domain-containing protein [Bacteroidales bacterium]
FQSAYIYKLDEHGCYEPNCDVGVEEVVEKAKGFTLVPNPARDYVSIVETIHELSLQHELYLLDLTGKIVKQFKMQGSELKIQVGDLEKGIYLVKIGTETQKLIIE